MGKHSIWIRRSIYKKLIEKASGSAKELLRETCKNLKKHVSGLFDKTLAVFALVYCFEEEKELEEKDKEAD